MQQAEEKRERGGFHHALIVDDNPQLVAAMATRIMAAGWACLTALDGHDAMDLMSRHPVDAIVTDLDMPIVDGYSIVELALSFQHCPVLVVTGSSESAARCRADYPNVPILLKPVTSEQILDFLNQAVHQSADRPADAA